MALCDLNELKDLIGRGEWTYASESCKRRVREYDLQDEDVVRMVLALSPVPIAQGGNFRKEFGAAQTNFGILASDDYRIWYDEQLHQLCRANRGLLFYVKLALYTADEEKLCVIVAIHPST